MSEQDSGPPTPPPPGAVVWRDLTVPDADGIADFYRAVCGWSSEPVAMDGYNDHAMTRADGEVVGGVCHARGPNADLPPAWLVYVQVADLRASLDEVRARGGEVIREPRALGSYGEMAVIRDPAGAALALMGPPRADG
jgi:hypothetical protein